MTGPARIRFLGCLLALLAAGGCGVRSSPPPQLLVLAPLAHDVPVAAPLPASFAGLVVGPVDLPDYSEHTHLVILRNDSEMQVIPLTRWAEPLAANFSRVLVENLSRLLGTGQIATLGGVQAPASLQVTVEITEFVTTDAGQARLTAYWRVLGDGGRRVLASDKSSYVEAVAGSGHAAHAAALSRTIAALSEDLARAVRKTSGAG